MDGSEFRLSRRSRLKGRCLFAKDFGVSVPFQIGKQNCFL